MNLDKKKNKKREKTLKITIEKLKNKKYTIEENLNVSGKNDLNNNSVSKTNREKILPILTPIYTSLNIIISLLIAFWQYSYAIRAEKYFGIEANLLYQGGTFDKTLVTILINMLVIIFVPTLLFINYKLDHGFNSLFKRTLFLLSLFIIYIGLNIMPIMNTLSYNILIVIVLFPAFLATIGFWFMYQDDVKDDKSWRCNTISNIIINRIIGFKKDDAKAEPCNQKNNVLTLIFGTVCILSSIFVIGIYSYIVLYIACSAYLENSPSKKKNYEIVEKISHYEPNIQSEQTISASNIQVVILHRGSQVLLMNGKIDDNKTVNPKEDMSSSNLVIDTSSYEFQEASQYRFYRKEFNDVKPDPPPKK